MKDRAASAELKAAEAQDKEQKAFDLKYLTQKLSELANWRIGGGTDGRPPITKLLRGRHCINRHWIQDALTAKILTIAPHDGSFGTRDSFLGYCLKQIAAPDFQIDTAITWLLEERYLTTGFTPTRRFDVEARLIDPLADHFDRATARASKPSHLTTALIPDQERIDPPNDNISPVAIIEGCNFDLQPEVVQALSDYLRRVIDESGELPPYYPERLRTRGGVDMLWQDIRVARVLQREHNGSPPIVRGSYGLSQIRRRANPQKTGSNASSTTVGRKLPWTKARQQPESRHIVILGDAGSGKSSLLRYETRFIAQAALTALPEVTTVAELPEIPVLRRLTDVWDLVRQDRTVMDIVLQSLRGEGVSEPVLEMITALSGSGRVTLLLDGWDEVAAGIRTPDGSDPRELLRRKIERFAKSYAGRILLTSRKVRYGSNLMPEATELGILPFSFSQIRQFLRRWVGRNLIGNRFTIPDHLRFDQTKWELQFRIWLELVVRSKAIKDLLKTPLMLALTCRAFEGGHGEPAYTAAQIYKALLHGLLFDWRMDDKAITIDSLERNAYLIRLSCAAWAVQLRAQFTDIDLAQAFGFDPVSHVAEARSLIAELTQTGILVEASNGDKMFVHRGFQEYLTAVYLARQPDAIEQLKQLARYNDWHDVIVLASALEEHSLDLAIAILTDGGESAMYAPLYELVPELCIRLFREATQQGRDVREEVDVFELYSLAEVLNVSHQNRLGEAARLLVEAKAQGKTRDQLVCILDTFFDELVKSA